MDERLEQISNEGNVQELKLILREDEFLLDRLICTSLLPFNPLHIAASQGHVEFARELLIAKPELAKELDRNGCTPLHLAATNGYVQVVKEILSHRVGKELCAVQDKDGMLPIHTAALNGKFEALKELFDVEPEAAKELTCQDDTVIHLAVRSNCIQVVKFLIEKMCGDVSFLNAKNAKGNTILHIASAKKKINIVKYLLSKSEIEVNALNYKNFTPLDVLWESPTEIVDKDIKNLLEKYGGKIFTEDYTATKTTSFCSHSSQNCSFNHTNPSNDLKSSSNVSFLLMLLIGSLWASIFSSTLSASSAEQFQFTLMLLTTVCALYIIIRILTNDVLRL